MLRYWIWLSTRKYLSDDKKVAVLEHFGTSESVFLADEPALRELHLNKNEVASLMDKDLLPAERILKTCDNRGVSVLTWSDAAYPSRLKAISNPPCVLYYEGKLPNFDANAVISMVGTRSASAYGMKCAKELGYQLGKGGAIVVSGSAVGIDCMCLEGAMTAGATVVSILGNGTDVVYPKRNRRLYEDVRRNGCLISEFPPGTKPMPANFPTRNRIISGLSLGVVVVEAPSSSGALITADLALEQGRDVFVVPANLGVDSYKGNFRLLKEGATLVEDGADVLRHYVGRFDVDLRKFPADFPSVQRDETAVRESAPETFVRKTVDRNFSDNYIEFNDILPKVSAEGAAILRVLCGGEAHVDEIVEASGLPVAKISSAVTVLEIKKFVKRLPGQRFLLAENIKVEEHNE